MGDLASSLAGRSTRPIRLGCHKFVLSGEAPEPCLRLGRSLNDYPSDADCIDTLNAF